MCKAGITTKAKATQTGEDTNGFPTYELVSWPNSHDCMPSRWRAKKNFLVSATNDVFLPPNHIQHLSSSQICLWNPQIQFENW